MVIFKGFSLLELLITFSILGIIASFAYPCYRTYVVRTHRLDGQMALLDLASRMEQYYALQNTYQTATIAAGLTTDVLSQQMSPQGWYTLAILEASASSFSVQATPILAQAYADKQCQSLTLNHLGVKGNAPGPGGQPSRLAAACW